MTLMRNVGQNMNRSCSAANPVSPRGTLRQRTAGSSLEIKQDGTNMTLLKKY